MTPTAEPGPGFEQALQRLEAIVHDLERGDVGLDEALAHYEQGVALLRRCYALLQQAEQKIVLLTGLDEAGNPLTAPFDATATVERLAPGGDGDPIRPAGRHRGGRRPAAGDPLDASPGGGPQSSLLF